MLWSYVQLDDGTQFAYSETRDDGTVRVAVERPVDLGSDHAECFLPAVNWFNVEGFSTDDLDFLTEFVRSNAPFIFELAERQKAGSAVSALAPSRSTVERKKSHNFAFRHIHRRLPRAGSIRRQRSLFIWLVCPRRANTR